MTFKTPHPDGFGWGNKSFGCFVPSILYYAACLIRFVEFDDKMKRISYMCLISCMAPLIEWTSEGEEHVEMKSGCLSKAMTLSTCLWFFWMICWQTEAESPSLWFGGCPFWRIFIWIDGVRVLWLYPGHNCYPTMAVGTFRWPAPLCLSASRRWKKAGGLGADVYVHVLFMFFNNGNAANFCWQNKQ